MSRTDKKISEEIKKRNDALKNKNNDGQAESKPLELTIDKGTIFGEKEMQRLLSKKDELVKQKTKDGRNQYQIEIQKLKDKLKAKSKEAKAQGFKSLKFKFSDLLNHVKKQEREGKFDRGAEEKNKNALRKKMLDKQDGSKRGGVHPGTKQDKSNELVKRVADDPEYKALKKKNKTKTGPGSR